MSLKYEVKLSDGLRFYRHGRLHRMDGPADIWSDNDMYWVQYGRLHRTDGPANIWPQASIVRYFIKNVEYTKKIYESKIRN